MLQLNLKNVYKLLSQRDYPCFSYCLLPQRTGKKRTVVTFWYELFRSCFPPETDLSIFQTEDGRSRSLSKLLSGVENRGFRATWFDQIGNALTPDTVEEMTVRLYRMLAEARTDRETADQKIDVFIDSEGEENGTSAKTEAFFRNLREEPVDPQARLLRSAYLLAWMGLFALFASNVDHPALSVLRMKEKSVWEQVLLGTRNVSAAGTRTEILSAGTSEAVMEPLAPDQYVGRQALLTENAARIVNGTKLAVTGIGGIGKTEFVRQLVRFLRQKNRFTRIAWVQYSLGLAESFAAAFPETAELKSRDVLQKVRGVLEEAPGTLLVVDNVDQGVSEDSALGTLKKMNCAVLLTSRLHAPEGFREIRPEPLNGEESRKLFNIASGKTNSVRGSEEEAFFERLNGHPFLLTVLGKIAGIKYLSVEEMNQRLFEEGLASMKYVEQARIVEVGAVLESMFRLTGLSERDLRMLRLIAAMPCAAYTPGSLIRFMPDLYESQDELADRLQMLSDLSWLNRTSEGYMMHPVIAERLLGTPLTAEGYPILWKKLAGEVSESGFTAEQRKDIPLLLETVRHFSGLNRDAVTLINRLEMTVVSSRLNRRNDLLLKMHRDWLDTTEHSDQEEAAWWIAYGYDCIVNERNAEYRKCFENLDRLPSEALLDHERFFSLCNMLDNLAIAWDGRNEMEKLILRLDPGTERIEDAVSYACLLSTFLRVQGRVPEAIEMLTRTCRIYSGTADENSISLAGLCHRLVVALADSGRYAEAIPYSDAALRIMRKNGYAEDSMTMVNTCSANAFMRMMGNEPESALEIYRAILEILAHNGRKETAGYAIIFRNYFNCLLFCGEKEETRIAAEILEQMMGSGIFSEGDQERAKIQLAVWLAENEALNRARMLLQSAEAYFRDIHEMKQMINLCRLDGARAEILRGEGKTAEAVRLLEESVAKYREIFPCENTMLAWLEQLLSSARGEL